MNEKDIASLVKSGQARRDDFQNYLNGLDRSIKKMQATSNELDRENILAERKIKALKDKLQREKEERELIGGPRWKSSVSPARKSATKPKKFQVLSDKSLDYYKQAARIPGVTYCGQCDDKKAKVDCNECNESYCSMCFKAFHGKGALKKHTWINIEKKKSLQAKAEMENANKNELNTQMTNTTAQNVNSATQKSNNNTTPKANPSTQQGNSLWVGTYDEVSNAKEFARALQEWRMESKVSQQNTTSVETEPIATNQPKINFTSSLSYLEKMAVKKKNVEKELERLRMERLSIVEGRLQRNIDSINNREDENEEIVVSEQLVKPRGSQTPCILLAEDRVAEKVDDEINNDVVIYEVTSCDEDSDVTQPHCAIVTFENNDVTQNSSEKQFENCPVNRFENKTNFVAEDFEAGETEENVTVDDVIPATKDETKLSKTEECNLQSKNESVSSQTSYRGLDQYYLIGVQSDKASETNNNNEVIYPESQDLQLMTGRSSNWRPAESVSESEQVITFSLAEKY